MKCWRARKRDWQKLAKGEAEDMIVGKEHLIG